MKIISDEKYGILVELDPGEIFISHVRDDMRSFNVFGGAFTRMNLIISQLEKEYTDYKLKIVQSADTKEFCVVKYKNAVIRDVRDVRESNLVGVITVEIINPE